jgi:hypothetical protein
LDNDSNTAFGPLSHAPTDLEFFIPTPSSLTRGSSTIHMLLGLLSLVLGMLLSMLLLLLLLLLLSSLLSLLLRPRPRLNCPLPIMFLLTIVTHILQGPMCRSLGWRSLKQRIDMGRASSVVVPLL